MPCEHDGIELQVVPDFLDGGVFEDGPQHPEHVLLVRPEDSQFRRRWSQEPVLDVAWTMPDRDIPRRSGPGGKCQPDNAGPNRGRTVGQYPQPEAARRAQLSRQLLDLLRPRQQAVVLAGGFRRGRVLHHEGPESELRKQLVAGLT